MMKKGFIAGIFCLIAMILIVPVFARGELSNVQKLEAAYTMYADYKKEFPSVMDIAPQAAMKELEKGGLVFLDTRKPAEMKVSMLPNAISQKEFFKNRESYRDKQIVAYCTISYRSGLFAKQMKDEGITIYNLQGGIVAWVLEGGKVYNGDRETNRVHVYGKKWNLLPTEYEAVIFGWFERF
jgi:rhodanese-related sulfurtransferase